MWLCRQRFHNNWRNNCFFIFTFSFRTKLFLIICVPFLIVLSFRRITVEWILSPGGFGMFLFITKFRIGVAVLLLTCIPEAVCSNLDQVTGHPKIFPQSLHAYIDIIFSNRPHIYPFNSVSTQHWWPFSHIIWRSLNRNIRMKMPGALSTWPLYYFMSLR
jgi:hypothetical protein